MLCLILQNGGKRAGATALEGRNPAHAGAAAQCFSGVAILS